MRYLFSNKLIVPTVSHWKGAPVASRQMGKPVGHPNTRNNSTALLFAVFVTRGAAA